MGQELSFRWDSDRGHREDPPSPFGACMSLSHALLDGGVLHRSSGALFVSLDLNVLQSSVADALCAPLFVIQLPASLEVDPSTTRRLAQLHARGYRFALADLGGMDDPRWAWAPFATYAKLPASQQASSSWAAWLARAEGAGMRVIADGLKEPQDYLQLRRLGVQFFQGALIHPVQEESVRALPCCDLQVLHKLNRLVEQGASRDALAMVGATDPALVIRLLMLQRIYAGGAEAGSAAGLTAALPVSGGATQRLPLNASGWSSLTLAEVLESLPYRVLAGWMRILRYSSFDPDDSGRAWSTSVREQMYNFRARLIGARMCATPQELEARVFSLYRRLCARETWSFPPESPVAAVGHGLRDDSPQAPTS